jgi:hypothetical protein
LAFLAEALRSGDEAFRFWVMRGLRDLNTKEARTLLWEARAFTFATEEKTAAFRSELDRVTREWP